MKVLNRISIKSENKPLLFVTGASGFIGRHFINAIRDDFRIYAMARRNQKEAGVNMHPNIIWVLGDIASESTVERVTDKIARKGGVDYIFHFAGYYDYDNKEKPEYSQVNIEGTRHLLKNTEKLGIKRFFYASSLTVSKLSSSGAVIDENSPADAVDPYPRSKARAEALVREYSERFPCVIVRLGAIFSDWCEFGPLYMLLTGWLSGGWKARFIGGKGRTAIPYMHIVDLIIFLLHLLKNQDKLARCETVIASTESSLSHKELYDLSRRYFYGETQRPFFIPKPLSFFGASLMYNLGKLTGRLPMERPWMTKYIDTRMDVHLEKTRQITGWSPISRYHLRRRLLYLIENMKSNPYRWRRVNHAFFYRTDKERPNVKIYESLVALKEESVEENIRYVISRDNLNLFPNYQKLSMEELRDRILYFYQMIEVAIHYGDRRHVLTFIPNLARARYLEGFSIEEITRLVDYIGQFIIGKLIKHPSLDRIQGRIESEIRITTQMIIDEFEDIYDRLRAKHPCPECRVAGIKLCTHDAGLTSIKI